jgi:predicted N-acyltransferase
MPDGRDPTTVNVITAITDVPAAQWDACAGADDPFICHAFLKALEDSGSVSSGTGWQPQHLVIEDEGGELLACAPLYVKGHSYGEYVFDWGWADAYQRAGGRYYPKLLSAVPFTPVTGRRLLVRPDAPQDLADMLIGGMVQLAERFGVSSLHVNFPTEAEWGRLTQAGLIPRLGQQFHWENRGYETFEDFLASLNSRKRKAVRKERRAATADGIDIRALSGDEIETRHWDAFYRFYRDTSERKWGSAYLNREFFERLHATMGERVVLIMALSEGHPVGGALNMLGSDTLYGRYWGSAEAHKFLHFEVCYYQAIDYAIEHRLKWVEAGAQGPHKMQRGYLPRLTYSAHWIKDDSFRELLERHLAEECEAITHEVAELSRQTPYRQESE